jgi:hypothetical protein
MILFARSLGPAMDVSHLIVLLSAGARAALVLAALIGTANLATHLAFTPRAIQAKVDDAIGGAARAASTAADRRNGRTSCPAVRVRLARLPAIPVSPAVTMGGVTRDGNRGAEHPAASSQGA